jgi:hypothetical protein
MKRFLVLATVAASTFLSLGLASATSAVATSTNLPSPGGAPMKVAPHAGPQTVSLNWSGYAATSTRKFTYVEARFVQPALKCSGKPTQWTSNWTGLDGFNDQTVEQDGTFATCAGKDNMTAEYEAWYEMYPAGSVGVFTVKPGDVIDSSVRFADGKFILKVGDVTSNKWATKSAACSTCERASAEWIVERPAVCGNSKCTTALLTALADFGVTSMNDAKATVEGGTARGIGSFTNNYPIDMVQPLKKGGFISLDAVGPVSAQNHSFEVQWERSGTPIPIKL